jgi:hypothetical protein
MREIQGNGLARPVIACPAHVNIADIEVFPVVIKIVAVIADLAGW